MQERGWTVAIATEQKCIPMAAGFLKIPKYKTNVPNARSEKEGKKRQNFDMIPGEFHQKISTCAFCPKLVHNIPGQGTE
jgi:hypothetical protein